jgi:hypothetical protein
MDVRKNRKESLLRDPDRFLRESATAARANLDRCVADTVAFAQLQPEKALLSAVATGYVLRMLPLFGVVRILVRLSLGLIKPALLIYCGAKALGKLRGYSPAESQTEAETAPTRSG